MATVNSPEYYSTSSGTYRFSQHAPDAYIMDWTGENLPDAESYFITDVDLVIRNRRGYLMVIELKKKGAKCKGHQRRTLAIFNNLIKAGLLYFRNVVPVGNEKYPITFFGTHVLTLEGTTFSDGRIYWNGAEITEAEAIKRLSFRDPSLIVSKP